MLQDLGAAATAVSKALNDLLQHIRAGAGADREVSFIITSISYKIIKYQNVHCVILDLHLSNAMLLSLEM